MQLININKLRGSLNVNNVLSQFCVLLIIYTPVVAFILTIRQNEVVGSSFRPRPWGFVVYLPGETVPHEAPQQNHPLRAVSDVWGSGGGGSL